MSTRTEQTEQSSTPTGSQGCPRRAQLIRWLPTLAGLALAGAGLGAFGLAASEVTVTVAPAKAPDAGPDPLALLRDDVSTLQGDVTRLGEGLGGALEQLAQGLDARGAERSEALSGELRTLSQRLAAAEASQRKVLEALTALQRRVAESPLAPAAGAPAPAEPQPAEPQPVAAAPAEPAPPAPAAAEPARPKGLFSFRLGAGLDFDLRQRFEVIASLSRVGFDAKSTLHDFTGVTSEVQGWLETKLGAADQGSRGEVTAGAASLKTGVEGRDEEMLVRLEATKFPQIRFELRGFSTQAVDPEKRTLSGEALGELEIHGVRREVKVPVKLEVDPSRRLVLTGEARVKLTDFGIEPPTVAGGAISMEDEVKVWLALRLRSLGKAQE